MADVDERLKTGVVLPSGESLGFRRGFFTRSPGATGEYKVWLSQQITQRINIVNAVEHHLEALSGIDPRPQAPVGLAVDLNRGVEGRAQPAVVDEQARAANAGVPAHLLERRHSLRALAHRRRLAGHALLRNDSGPLQDRLEPVALDL